jgi:hypothetical protein
MTIPKMPNTKVSAIKMSECTTPKKSKPINTPNQIRNTKIDGRNTIAKKTNNQVTIFSFLWFLFSKGKEIISIIRCLS